MCFLLETRGAHAVISACQTTSDNKTPTPSWEYVLDTQWNTPLYTDWACSRTYKWNMSCQKQFSHVAFSHVWGFRCVIRPSQYPTDVQLPVPQHLGWTTKKCYFSTYIPILTINIFCLFVLPERLPAMNSKKGMTCTISQPARTISEQLDVIEIKKIKRLPVYSCCKAELQCCSTQE